MYYPGHAASRARVEQMSREALLDLMKQLYGVPEGVHELTLEQVRDEALRQHECEWAIPPAHVHHYPDAEA